MATLIVFLPPPGAPAEFDYVLSNDGLALARQSRAPLDLLPAPGAGGEIVAMVPAQALAWHRATLPAGVSARQPARLRAVLAGLLEEQLLDDAQELHLAVFPPSLPGQPAWVAACRRDWLGPHLRALEAAGRPVARIVPECAPAADAAQATLWVSEALAPAALLLSRPEGVALLPLGAASLALAAWPAQAPVLAEPAVAALAEQAFARPITLQTAAQRWLEAARGPWNLAQFEFARGPLARRRQALARGWQALRHAPQWRATRWSALALLLVQLAGLNAWAWKERAQQAEQRAALRALLTATFPDTRLVLDAPLQMERAVAELRHSRGAGDVPGLDTLLQALGAALPAGTALQAIDYATTGPARVQLRDARLDAAQTAELTRQLAAHGWRARAEGQTLHLERAPGTP